MKKITILLVVAVIAILSFDSCESNTYSEIATVTNPTYQANIKAVFNSNCTSCHSPNGTDESPYLTTYAEVKDAIENGVVICRIDNPSDCFSSDYMPQSGRMPQTTIDMIKLWQANGFIN